MREPVTETALTPNQRRTAKARATLARQQADRAKAYTRKGLAAYQASADPNSAVGQLLSSYRDALTADAGGEENLSAARGMLIETTAVSLILCRALDGRLLSTLANTTELDATTLPLLAERRATADSLRHSLKLLGLSRAARNIETLEQYMRRTAAARTVEDATEDDGNEPAEKEEREEAAVLEVPPAEGVVESTV
jgi:hypothetical protein